MPPIKQILSSENSVEQKMNMLREKAIHVPAWSSVGGLRQEYEPKLHPVMDKTIYPDIVNSKGMQKVTRIAIGLQKLAVKRMQELCCGIPVQRIYSPKNERQKEIQGYIENVFKDARIDLPTWNAISSSSHRARS